MRKSTQCAFVYVHEGGKKGLTTIQCSNSVEETGKSWCKSHNKARKKVYFGYKNLHKALDALPEIDVTECELEQCDSMDNVVEISAALRHKLSLLSRCIAKRAYFTERFFGNTEDFGHEKYRTILEHQLSETQALFQVAEQRAYKLHLASINATWVQEDKTSDTESENCSLFDEDREPCKSPASFLSQSSVEDELDPVEVVLAEKRNEIWEQIWTRLARYCAPIQSRFYAERLEVIWACVRRGVCADPTLMLLSQKYNAAIDMLEDATLDLLTLRKIWAVIKDLRVDDVRAAIDDVLHPVRATGEYVVVFKVRVHKDLSHVSLPFHAWGHVAAFFPCYTCVRRTCKTVDDIVEMTRYILLCDTRIARASNLFKYPYRGVMSLLLCGFIPNSFVPLELNPARCRGHTSGMKDVELLDYELGHLIRVGMSLTDSKVNDFVNACFRRSDLVVCFRKGFASKEFCSKPSYGQTMNATEDRLCLKHVLELCQPTDKFALQDAAPYITPFRRVSDCFQLAITPEKRGEMQDLITEIVHLWYQVYGVDNFTGLVRAVASPYIKNQEIEFSDDHSLILNVEPAVDMSFKTLWGRLPRENEIEKGIKVGRI